MSNYNDLLTVITDNNDNYEMTAELTVQGELRFMDYIESRNDGAQILGTFGQMMTQIYMKYENVDEVLHS